MNSTINQFLSHATRVVEQNINIDRYGLGEFAKDLFMSKSALNKKLKVITGQTPTEFIESVKFRFAFQLFSKSDLSIKEIAYSSGFNDPKYFTRRFKREFGITPKEYKLTAKRLPSYIWNSFNLN